MYSSGHYVGALGHGKQNWQSGCRAWRTVLMLTAALQKCLLLVVSASQHHTEPDASALHQLLNLLILQVYAGTPAVQQAQQEDILAKLAACLGAPDPALAASAAAALGLIGLRGPLTLPPGDLASAKCVPIPEGTSRLLMPRAVDDVHWPFGMLLWELHACICWASDDVSQLEAHMQGAGCGGKQSWWRQEGCRQCCQGCGGPRSHPGSCAGGLHCPAGRPQLPGTLCLGLSCSTGWLLSRQTEGV